jgi:pyoverdine/dityrosine biosynthesis protein Dit1
METLEAEERAVACVQLPKLAAYIKNSARIEFVLPAFPVKSPNPRKVLGRLPDMAERISLAFLSSLCRQIELIYPPGARILICSDGYVFADVIGVTDGDVSLYQRALKSLITETDASALGLFNLGDAHHFSSHEADKHRLRELLCAEYGQSSNSVKQMLLDTTDGLELYRSITRFMFEDRLALDGRQSRTALQRESRQRAVDVIRRSWAWGALLENEFPDAIRLSIHPQPANSPKMGIHMMETHDSWLTPWHGVAVRQGDRFRLMKCKEAEELGASIVYFNGAPSHYTTRSTPDDTHDERLTA